jgi:hypothetical protein
VASGWWLVARGNVSACRRVGVSAFAKRHQLRRDLLVIIAVSKSSLNSPDADTPNRRHASPACGDITIICETVHWVHNRFQIQVPSGITAFFGITTTPSRM